VKGPRPLAFAVAKNAGHRKLGVIVQNRPRHAAKKCERLNVAVAERLSRLRRIGNDKAGVRVRQIKCEEVNLPLNPANDADRLAKVHLGMARRMRQRDKHLLRSLPPPRNVILHDREPAREAVFVAKPFKNPLRRVLLLLRPASALRQNPVDDSDAVTYTDGTSCRV
jgi:hypothetical protein